MKVYVVIAKYFNTMESLDVFETRKDAGIYFDEIVDRIIRQDRNLFELSRFDDLVLLGYEDHRDGSIGCKWCVTILEKEVKHYSEEDLKVFGP